MKIRVFPDVDELIRAAADRIIEASREAVASRGRFLLVLSGGNSPKPLFRLLADSPYRETLPWDQTYVLWSDERYVPFEDECSNAGMARRLLLGHVPVSGEHVMPMYIAGKGPEEAAAAYETAIKKLGSGEAPRLDLTLLGCGPDGHTASLFPGSPVLKDGESLVRAVQHGESDIARVTMTPQLLNQSRQVVFIVYGEQKAETIHEVLEGPYRPDTLPAQIISPAGGEVVWLLDRSAAAKVTVNQASS